MGVKIPARTSLVLYGLANLPVGTKWDKYMSMRYFILLRENFAF